MGIGYIYIRTNEYWDLYDAFKLGKTTNIPDREQTYTTTEIKRGFYVMIIEIDLIILDTTEKQLQIYFNELNFHIKFNAGIEFYKKEIINYIIPYFDTNNIKYKILSIDEINGLVGKTRINNNIYNPRDYQKNIIDKSYEYFRINKKGLLIQTCGIGKTLISLWIAQKLNSNTILIGVPNKLLLEQWKEVICVLFKSIPYLIVSSCAKIENIIQFLENNKNKCIIITTYSSAHKIYITTKHTNFIFDIKINDECHHLTTYNMELAHTTKTYIQMLNIPSIKQLSLTATLKQLENTNNDNNIISNNNIEYFGEIIDKKCLLWAINENIVCDYVIQTFITKEQNLSRFNVIDENDKRLFLGAYASLKSIFDKYSHHLLIYSNNKDNSSKLIQYIKMLLEDNYFDLPDLYYSNYHSEMKSRDQTKIIHNFEEAKLGIITCIFSLGEGWNCPLLDGVVFAENMTSNIRIVQSALRASRKNNKDINKKTKIILPILHRDDWLEDAENSDLKKVREVIYQIGLEDKTIIQKIKVYNINIEKYKTKKESVTNVYEYDDELTQKLILKTIKRSAFTITYEKAKKIIFNNNIKNKEKYYELCEKDYRLPKEPELVFKEQFTNWIDYLSIERIYYDFETCKNKITEYLRSYPEIKKNSLNLAIMSYELCKIDELFPPNGLWVEYYNVKDLKDIINITNVKKHIGIIL